MCFRMFPPEKTLGWPSQRLFGKPATSPSARHRLLEASACQRGLPSKDPGWMGQWVSSLHFMKFKFLLTNGTIRNPQKKWDLLSPGLFANEWCSIWKFRAILKSMSYHTYCTWTGCHTWLDPHNSNGPVAADKWERIISPSANSQTYDNIW